MKKTTAITIRSLIVLPAFLWIFSSLGEAATTQVDCSSASLQAAVKKARPGDTLLVSGTCNENLVIYEQVARITLDGQGKAAINALDESRATIRVMGRGITIKGFTVTGGRTGIVVLWGGQAVIDGNTVQQSGGIWVRYGSSAAITNNTVQNSRLHGIALVDNAFARILNNTVKNSRLQGILVVQSSSAWIGATDIRDKTPSPNIIENNRRGIVVGRSSAARIVGNTIRNNKSDGIFVLRASAVHISSNTIDANGGDGISVLYNSHVGMRAGRGKIFRAPTSTTSNNSGFGIRCTSNSDVGGSLGSLIGNKGKKNFAPSCVDGLKP